MTTKVFCFGFFLNSPSVDVTSRYQSAVKPFGSPRCSIPPVLIKPFGRRYLQAGFEVAPQCQTFSGEKKSPSVEPKSGLNYR